MDFTLNGKNWTTKWAAQAQDDIRMGVPAMDILVEAKTKADEIEGLIGFFVQVGLTKDKAGWKTESLRKLVQDLAADHVEKYLKDVKKNREEAQRLKIGRAATLDLFKNIATKIGVEVKEV